MDINQTEIYAELEKNGYVGLSEDSTLDLLKYLYPKVVNGVVDLDHMPIVQKVLAMMHIEINNNPSQWFNTTYYNNLGYNPWIASTDWKDKITFNLKASTALPQTISLEVFMSSKLYEVEASKIIYGKYDLSKPQLGKDANFIDKILLALSETSSPLLATAVLDVLVSNTGYSLIDKHYEMLKEQAFEKTNFSHKKHNCWINHLIETNDLSKIEEISKKMEFDHLLVKHIENTTAVYGPFATILNRELKLPTECLLLTRLADEKNKDCSCKLTGDLTTNTSLLEKYEAVLEALRVVQPDKYKNMFITYAESTLVSNLTKNALIPSILLKASRVDIKSNIVDNILKNSRDKSSLAALYIIKGWAGLSLYIQKTKNAGDLVNALMLAEQTDLSLAIDYDDVMEDTAHKLNKYFNKPTGTILNDSQIQLATRRIFNDSDIERLKSLGLDNLQLFKALYTAKYKQIEDTMALPEIGYT